jgi:hypothetical protein
MAENVVILKKMQILILMNESPGQGSKPQGRPNPGPRAFMSRNVLPLSKWQMNLQMVLYHNVSG